jgi:nicotinamidase/pyrazinamidase
MNNLRHEYDSVIAINVDIQNDFCPGGSLAVADGDTVVEPMNAINRWVREHQGNVIFTADWHPEDTAHFADNGGPWPVHCVRHKAGAAFHDDLKIGDHDTIAHKGMSKEDDGYSGWKAYLSSDSPLYNMGDGRYEPGVHTVEQAVREKTNYYRETKKKVALIVGGLATDYCVRATVLDAFKRTNAHGFPDKLPEQLGVYVVEDAIRAVDVQPGDGERAIAEMKQAGATFVSAEEILSGSVIAIKERASWKR